MSFDIVIPTHHRYDNLKQILLIVKGQQKNFDGCYLLVEPGVEQVRQIDGLLKEINLDATIIENKYNIGTDASILKCFEIGNSEWVYVAGDSKLLLTTFAEVISEEIQTANASAIIFSSDSDIEVGSRIENIKQLNNSGVTFGDFILASNFIYHRNIIRDYLRFSHRTNSSRVGHVAMPLMHLHNGGTVYLSEKTIIKKFLNKPSSYDPGLAWADCLACFSLLALLPLTVTENKHLNEFVLRYEKFNQKWTFVKYVLIKIFREGLDIRRNLLLIKSIRYTFKNSVAERTVISVLVLLNGLQLWRK